MRQIMKRTLALFMAVMLCVSMVPFSAFAVEAAPLPEPPSESQGEEVVVEPTPEPVIIPTPEPDGTAPPAEEESPAASPIPSVEPTAVPTALPGEVPSPSASAKPTAAPTALPSTTPTAMPSVATSVEPSTTPDASDERMLDGVAVKRVWPTDTRRMAAARAAGVGAQGVLEVGYNCFKSEVGTLPTLGYYLEFFPAKTLKVSGQSIAAYCLDMARFVP